MSKLSYMLDVNKAVLAGGSALWCLTRWCEPQDYDGDLDIYVNFSRHLLSNRIALFDLLFQSCGYIIEGLDEVYGVHEVHEVHKCPRCNESEHPLHHFDSKESKVVCINCALQHELSVKYAYSIRSDYSCIQTIKLFREYVHLATHRKIQLIFVDSVQTMIDQFDLSFCKTYFNGIVFFSCNPEETKQKIGWIHVDKALNDKQKIRFQKYAARGFEIRTKHSVHMIDLIQEHQLLLQLHPDIFKYVLKPFL